MRGACHTAVADSRSVAGQVGPSYPTPGRFMVGADDASEALRVQRLRL
jgi:hypothetical protein